MNADLEERILFVLSALEFFLVKNCSKVTVQIPRNHYALPHRMSVQDANEALDKCDRLILAKKEGNQAGAAAPARSNDNTSEPKTQKTSNGSTIVSCSKDQEQRQGKARRKHNKEERPHGKLSSFDDTTKAATEPVPQAVISLPKKTKGVQTDLRSSSSAAAAVVVGSRKQKSEGCKCNHQQQQQQGTVCVVRKRSHKKLDDIDVKKLIESIKGSNEEQWKNVRRFIRQVLLAELEQEKWTRKSTEELNTRLSKQNQILRAKLQEKRDERAKLDEEMHAMRSKFKAKTKAQDENQQIVLSKCEETFAKLNKLHEDLEGIQKKLVEEVERSPSGSASGSPNSSLDAGGPKRQIPQIPTEPPRMSVSPQGSDIERELMRERILHEYYPMMAESRFVMEKLLSSIGIRISRLIELNTRTNLPNEIAVSYTLNGDNGAGVDDGDDDEDLVRLFTNELRKADRYRQSREQT